MDIKSSCENCGRKLSSSKDFQYCEFCKSMWEAGKQDMFNRIKETTKLFIYGDSPPFTISEDNIEEFLKEVANGTSKEKI